MASPVRWVMTNLQVTASIEASSVRIPLSPPCQKLTTTYNVPVRFPSATTIEVRVHPSVVIGKKYANGGCKMRWQGASIPLGPQARGERRKATVMARKVADLLWDMLVNAGVTRCYGIVGDALNPVI